MSTNYHLLHDIEHPSPKICEAFYTTLMTKDFYSLTAAIIMVAAFIWACIRAWLLSMTHDEVLTLSWHVSGSFSQIFLFETRGLPDNNHLLNTLLMKLSTLLIGDNEFCARIPSLVGYALYLSACYLTLVLVATNLLIILGALLLAFHPYLMDFFSIARGYSLGMGLMMIGLYFILSWFSKPTIPTYSKTAVLSTMMFAFAVTANLSLLVPYISCLIIWLIFGVNLRIRHRAVSTSTLGSMIGLAKDYSLFILPSASFLLLTCIIPIKKIHEQKLFAIGGSDGFWVNTVGSIIDKSIYLKVYAFDSQVYGYWFVGLLILLALSMTIFTALKDKKSSLSPCCYPKIILAFIVISSGISIIQHYVLGVAYLSERRAIFLIPLLLLLLISLPKQFEAIKNSYLLTLPVYFAGFLLALHFVLCLNFRYYLDWRYDASTKEAMALLRSETINLKNTNAKITMGVNWIFEPGINYYIGRYKMDWVIKPVNKSGSDGFHDFYYELDSNTDILEKYGLQVLMKYPLSATYLAARKNPG